MLKSNSGMNDHFIKPFDVIIMLIGSFFHRALIFKLKSCYYWAQMQKNRRAKKMAAQKQMLWTSKNRQARK